MFYSLFDTYIYLCIQYRNDVDNFATMRANKSFDSGGGGSGQDNQNMNRKKIKKYKTNTKKCSRVPKKKNFLFCFKINSTEY